MSSSLVMSRVVRPAFVAALVAMSAAVAAPTSARATTVLQVTVPEMTGTSQWVVRAHVIAKRNVDLRRAGGGGLYTDVDLLITEVYKGVDVPSSYTLRMVGGRGEDGRTLKIPGMPGFVVGEDVVLFLEATSLGHIPCGLGQGVWRATDTGNGVWVRQSMGNGSAHMLRRGTDGRLTHADPWLVDGLLPLDDLIEQIFDADSATEGVAPGPAMIAPPSPLTVKP